MWLLGNFLVELEENYSPNDCSRTTWTCYMILSLSPFIYIYIYMRVCIHNIYLIIPYIGTYYLLQYIMVILVFFSCHPNVLI
jgi:hypothetical protein